MNAQVYSQSRVKPTGIRIRKLGLREYEPVWREMQAFTHSRNGQSQDELWLVEHPPVYTLGLNGKRQHLLQASNIPVVQVDRGGQITYHGPGQLVLYLLLDLQRKQMGIRDIVNSLEQSVIALLKTYHIDSESRKDAPGVYVQEKKIAALGLRVRRGCCYHGLSLNVGMDLSPFEYINPCGYPGMSVTQLRDLEVHHSMDQIADQLLTQVVESLGCQAVPEDAVGS